MSLQANRRSVVLSAAISMILAAPVFAAAPPAGGIKLEEIVVTAQRTETNLQETPVSVSAVSGEALTQQGASSLLDLTNFIPNLQVSTTTLQGGGNGRFAIRGIGQDAGSQAAVGLYVDDIYYPTGAGNVMGLFDIDRVEVLRGPQGTLFGRNTIGGAIQYVTVKPGREFGGYGEVTAGNFGRTDFNGALNIPLGDTLAARIAVGYNSRDGFVHDIRNNVDRGEDTRKLGRVQVRWTPSDALTVDLKGEWMANRTNGRPGIIKGYAGSLFPNGQNDSAQFPALSRLFFGSTDHFCPSVVANGPCLDVASKGDYQMAGYNAPDFAELDYAAGGLVVGWDLNDSVTLKSISGYSKTDDLTVTDADGTPASFLVIQSPATETKAFSEEVQLIVKAFDNRLSWTTGLFYYDEERVVPSSGISLGVVPVTQGDGTNSNLTSKAIFTQATFAFTDRLSGTVGLRYSDEKSDKQTRDSTPPFNATPYKVFKGSFTDTSPQVGLKFQATDDQMYYFNAAKGYRAGGFTADPGYAGGSKSYDPEEAWTYEVGARLEFLDRRLRLNPTVFFTDWKGIQVNTLIPIPEAGAACLATNDCRPGVGTTPQNMGDAEIRGFEFEALFQATDRLTLQASVGYLDAKYTDIKNVFGQIFPAALGGFPVGSLFIPDLCDGNNDPTLAQLNPNRTAGQLAPLAALYECKGGSDLAKAPQFKFSVGARYAYPLSGGSQVMGMVDYGWTDKQRSEVANRGQVPLPSYGVLNARVQYTAPDNRWSLAVFGTNLTDELYYVGGTDFANGYTPGATVWDPARPMEYGATVKFNF